MLALRAAYAPWILHAGDTADWSSWQVPRRRLAEYLLVAVLAGDGFVVVGKQRLRVRPGQAYLLPPGTLADIGSPGGNHPAWVSFDVIHNPLRDRAPEGHAYDDELGRRKPWLQPSPRQVWGVELPLLIPEPVGGRCSSLLPAVVRGWRSGSELGVLRANHVLSGLLLDLVSQAHIAGATEPETPDLDAFVAKAESEMRDRLADGVGVDAFARAAGMSRSTFCALYPRLRGRTPGAFLRDLRLARAQLLLAGGSSRADTARAVGWADGTVLWRAMRRTQPK